MYRRLIGSLALLVAFAGCSRPDADAPPAEPVESIAPAPESVSAVAARVEQRIGGRVGVALVNSKGELVDSHRGDERFAMCSTFKLALAAMVLEQADASELSLDEVLEYGESDLLEYAPVTRERLSEGGLPIRDLAEASATLSDNTAANLLLARTGGPAALTDFFRRHGDATTRLDRNEPTLNENAAGDERDTTSPVAMAGLVQRLTLGADLSSDSRDQLVTWAVGNQTGNDRIRAGIPAGWRVGDKTGNCGNAFNDIGIVWPAQGEPFVLTVYIDRATAERPSIDAAFAELAGTAADWATARPAM